MVGVTRAQRLASVRRDDEACLYKAWLHTMTANTGNVEESSTRYVGTAVGMAINDAPVTELKKCAVKRQKQCPFGGMTRSMPVQGMAAHHDRKHCEGCDFLGRFCIIERSVARPYCGVDGCIFRMRGLPGYANYQFVINILRATVKNTRSDLAGSTDLGWTKIIVKDNRRAENEKLAISKFNSSELATQALEDTRQVLARSLEAG